MNILGIILSVVANVVIGYFWYSEAVFGKPWMKLMGLTKEDMAKAKKEMGPKYGLMLIGAVVMAFVLSVLINMLGAKGITEGAKVGFVAWVGFVATIGLNSVAFENRSVNLYFINVGYYLVGLVVMGAILGATM